HQSLVGDEPAGIVYLGFRLGPLWTVAVARWFRLRPARPRCWRRNGQHLTGAGRERLRRVLHAAPLGREDEQRPAVRAAERAGEGTPVQLDRLQDVPALGNAYAPLVWHVGVPDGALGVDADAVRIATGEIGPRPPVAQVAVVGDVEGGEPAAERLGDDQRRVVGRHRHAVREGEAVGDLTRRGVTRATRRDEGDDSGRLAFGRSEVTAPVEVAVSPPVHDDLVPVFRER